MAQSVHPASDDTAAGRETETSPEAGTTRDLAARRAGGRSRTAIWSAALADLLSVLAFVLIGLAAHGRAITVIEVLTVLLPFVLGLVLGWGWLRVWRRPLDPVPTGVWLWVFTVGVGLLLRWGTFQGNAPGFVIVTAIVLFVLLVGWRRLAVGSVRAAARRDGNRPDESEGSADADVRPGRDDQDPARGPESGLTQDAEAAGSTSATIGR